MIKVKICANAECGAKFETTRNDKLYCCDECRIYVCRNRISAREKEERRQDREVRERMKVRKKRRPKMSVAEIEAKAQKEGLSYGLYVAKYGL